MILEEIYEKAWNVSEDLEIRKHGESSISSDEQEFHVNEERSPENPEEAIKVSCSHQPRITALARSSLFTITAVTASKNPVNEGFILQVDGFFTETSAISIRNKKREFSEEQLEKMRERGKSLRNSSDRE